MKKITLITIFILATTIAFAFPKADVTIVVTKLWVQKDSVNFKDSTSKSLSDGVKIKFSEVGKKPTEIKPIHTMGAYEIGVSVWIDSYGDNSLPKLMEGDGDDKGWKVCEKYYYRLGEGEWIELITCTGDFFLKPEISIWSKEEAKTASGNLKFFAISRTTSCRASS